ncbi:hypothetical protein [Salegentibacter chungangensis]|uniref:Uncharacterized protein n=1 Tax=Salegentibacter chungangensis TaxID=1335724 RepID=A0ABW3NN02_9FLAO
MRKLDIFIGFLVGIAANIGGILLYISAFSEMNFDDTLSDAIENDYIGKLIALGAILNFLPFFVFIRKKQIYHARGVILATILTAICIAVFKFL